MNNSDKNPWKTLATKDIYKNPWISLREDQVVSPGEQEGIYGVVNFKNLAIGIIPIDEEGNTWLVGQYRYPLDEYSWEIPMGGGPLQDTALASAQRELLEETGITAGTWTELLKIHTSNSVTDETGYAFVATDLQFGKAMPEHTEELKIKELPFSEVVSMVMNGEITDSISMAAILKLHILLQEKTITL